MHMFTQWVFLPVSGNPHDPLQQLSSVWRQQALWNPSVAVLSLASDAPLNEPVPTIANQ